MIDIGTGDGLFVYRSAIQDRNRLYIGIDPNARPLEKISEKIYRNPSRGGAANALYLLASAEDLPSELNGIASEVHVLFPWGSLLRGLITADAKVLHGIRRICEPGAIVRIVFSLHAESDRSEILRLGLPEPNQKYVDAVLLPKFVAAGFKIVEAKQSGQFESLPSSWAKRLAQNNRRFAYMIQIKTND